MIPGFLGIMAAVILIVLAAIRASFRNCRERAERDFTRTLETALLPKETVKVICPQKKGRCVLTNKRLLFEEKGGFHAVSLDKIRSVQGKNAAGNRTTRPCNMVSLTVKADQDIIIQNLNDQFLVLAEQLQSGLKKRKK